MQYLDLDPSVGDIQVDSLVLNLVDQLLDAGELAAAVDAAVMDLEADVIGDFDSDPLYDFRAQRPIVTYIDGQISDHVHPSMRLSLITDVTGKPFLYLYGQEPDFRWLSITDDVLEIAEKFGVKRVFTFAGMPAPVPHTRPADMLIRTTKKSDDVQAVHGYIEHYGVLSDLVEYEAGQRDIDVKSLRVRVPLYLARGGTPFYSGALAAIEMVATLGGPRIPVGDLRQFDDEQLEALNAAMADSSEFSEVVAKLEEDYDHLPADFGFVRNDERKPAIPSPEEIGQAAERFLELSSESPLDRAIGQKNKDASDLKPDLGKAFMGRDLRRGRHRMPKPDESPDNQLPNQDDHPANPDDREDQDPQPGDSHPTDPSL